MLGWAGVVRYVMQLGSPRPVFTSSLLQIFYLMLSTEHSGDQVAHFSRRNLIQTSFLEHVFGTNSLCDWQEVAGGTSTSSGTQSCQIRAGCLSCYTWNLSHSNMRSLYRTFTRPGSPSSYKQGRMQIVRVMCLFSLGCWLCIV